jgi:hypothetical protein
MLIDNPKIKKISFEDYKKYFLGILESPDDTHIIFYRRTPDYITISFSYDNFIIFTQIATSELQSLYSEEELKSFDVTSDTSQDDPYFIKFKKDYIPRGIPEME